MEKGHFKRTTCRLCGGNKLELMVPIVATPIGGAFVSKDDLDKKQEAYSLDMYQCKECGHVQLLDVVDPKILFSNYSYFSGKTSLIKHFEEYAEKVIKKNNLKKGSFIVDVGSNDGAFLRFFKKKGMKVLGIDPAENIAKFANDSGIETLPKMFDLDTADKIRKDYGAADVITANNVFAHTDDMAGMAKSVRNLLADDGIFYFEVSYLVDVVDKMLLGTIFHEHLCYHTVKPLVSFLKQQGMELIDVERVPIQGGSIICKARLIGGKRQVCSSVNELIQLEDSIGVYKQGYLKSFSKKLETLKSEVTKLIQDIKSQGKSIAAFGAARGGTLITYLFGLGEYIEYIVDDDASKRGFYSPGYHIPVLPTSAMYELNPDYVIILAWVHSKSIIEKNQKYIENGGSFITFFPKVKVVDKNNPLDN